MLLRMEYEKTTQTHAYMMKSGKSFRHTVQIKGVLFCHIGHQTTQVTSLSGLTWAGWAGSKFLQTMSWPLSSFYGVGKCRVVIF